MQSAEIFPECLLLESAYKKKINGADLAIQKEKEKKEQAAPIYKL